MGRCRVVAPEYVRLPISDGDWVEIRKSLTYGETKKMQALAFQSLPDGQILPNLEILEMAQALGYLLAWSLVDQAGKPIPIDTDQQKKAALGSQDPETVKEIIQSISAYVVQLQAEVVAEKNEKAGETVSSATSPSAI